MHANAKAEQKKEWGPNVRIRSVLVSLTSKILEFTNLDAWESRRVVRRGTIWGRELRSVARTARSEIANSDGINCEAVAVKVSGLRDMRTEKRRGRARRSSALLLLCSLFVFASGDC